MIFAFQVSVYIPSKSNWMILGKLIFCIQTCYLLPDSYVAIVTTDFTRPDSAPKEIWNVLVYMILV